MPEKPKEQPKPKQKSSLELRVDALEMENNALKTKLDTLEEDFRRLTKSHGFVF